MILETEAGQWVVPPSQGCWLPRGESHRVQTSAGFEMLSLYCRDSLAQRLPPAAGLVPVGGLLREILEALAMPSSARKRRHLEALFAEEMALEAMPRLFVPPLRSTRLRTIEARLLDDPGDRTTLSQWAGELATTTRSLARAFASEARMSFTAYRLQSRLRAALVRLAEGASVTQVALELSFTSASNFIRVFRAATGMTPGQYLHLCRDRLATSRPAAAERPRSGPRLLRPASAPG